MSPKLAHVEIVSGPTCCGKSVYIAGLPPGAYDDLLFIDRANLADVRPGRRYLLHYNLLRPFDPPRFRPTRLMSYRRAIGYRLARLRAAAGRNPFAGEPWLNRLVAAPHAFHATVLVASRSVLLARAGGRSDLEPLLPEVAKLRYEREKWARVYASVDLPAVYLAWFEYLRQHRVEYSIVDSGSSAYRPVASDEDALSLAMS
jgi:hypothetical protein